MHPTIAKVREIAALETIAAKQEEIAALQAEILSKLEAVAAALPPPKAPKDAK